MFNILAYPPTPEQLRILNFISVGGDIWLLCLRLVTILVLVGAIGLWMGIIKQYFGEKIAKLSGLLLLISPTFIIFCLGYPLLSVKIFLFFILLKLLDKFNLVFFGFMIAFLIFFNVIVLNNKPAIFNKITLDDAVKEVNYRFMAEDSLLFSMEMPLWWRRISYNKMFFFYKEVMTEIMPFFDMESLFFQEVNPMGQKSVVMFYWPEIFLLILGIYFFNKKFYHRNLFFIFSLLVMALVNYIFSEGSVFVRLMMVMFPISIILGVGLVEIFKNIYLGGLVLIVLMYSLGINLHDLNVRTDYWLDNRPIAYQFWYKKMADLDLSKYDRIQISSVVGNSYNYCLFYLGEQCNDKKFVFESFDMSVDSTIANGVYAGFAGEFVGKRFKNDIANNWIEISKAKGLKMVDWTNIRDTIAFQYGNDIGLMIKE